MVNRCGKTVGVALNWRRGNPNDPSDGENRPPQHQRGRNQQPEGERCAAGAGIQSMHSHRVEYEREAHTDSRIKGKGRYDDFKKQLEFSDHYSDSAAPWFPRSNVQKGPVDRKPAS